MSLPQYFQKLLRLSTALLCSIATSPAITLSNKAGIEIEVEILRIESDQIEIRMANGQETTIQKNQLSDASHTLIQQLSDKQTEQVQSEHTQLNDLLGIPLFVDGNLWDDSPEAAAARLEWPRESLTEDQSSYRLYPKAKYRILESRPYSTALYGSHTAVTDISLVFANKGDFRFSDSWGPSYVESWISPEQAEQVSQGTLYVIDF